MTLSPREKWLAIITGTVIVAAIFAFYFLNQKNDAEQELLFPEELINEEEQKAENREVSTTIVIDVKGAVKKPGVYTMNEGDRVVDAIEKAGGLQSEADENQLNLASLLKDEMVIYVPKKGEEVTQTNVQSQNDDGKVRINSATSEELQKLQGIGPAKAEAIITYREENGPFKTVEDLLEVSGIGEKTLENIKDDIVVD